MDAVNLGLEAVATLNDMLEAMEEFSKNWTDDNARLDGELHASLRGCLTAVLNAVVENVAANSKGIEQLR